MKNPLGNIMQQAQKIQENLKQAQAELAAIKVTGESGAGLVKVSMQCNHAVSHVSIDPSLVNDDKDMLEDLVAAAINDAVQKVAKTTEDKMSGFTSGINLPAGFKLPF